VLYGLANRGSLPKVLARINPKTNTPLVATGLSVVIVLGLAIAFPINRLAEWTSAITLAIFILVCAALIQIKKDGKPAPEGTFVVPVWVPYGGIIACAALLLAGLIAG
jgi:APA family basic amino acid/polyamine antiporter